MNLKLDKKLENGKQRTLGTTRLGYFFKTLQEILYNSGLTVSYSLI